MSDAAYPAYETYPAHLEARLGQPLSRWLWLVKRRVHHYAVGAFATVRYPPSRLDTGERESGGP